jgi:hypothetical protein
MLIALCHSINIHWFASGASLFIISKCIFSFIIFILNCEYHGWMLMWVATPSSIIKFKYFLSWSRWLRHNTYSLFNGVLYHLFFLLFELLKHLWNLGLTVLSWGILRSGKFVMLVVVVILIIFISRCCKPTCNYNETPYKYNLTPILTLQRINCKPNIIFDFSISSGTTAFLM